MDPRLERLIQVHQQYRNARELVGVARRNFERHLDALEITDEILTWAMTTTPNNAPRSDEAETAWWIRARIVREGEHAHGNTQR